MAYVITDPCIDHKDTECLNVCPVDAIHPQRHHPDFARARQLHINADTCIHCGSCYRVCPARAILEEQRLPAGLRHFAEINASYFESFGGSSSEPTAA